jgi:hypothetical protein
LNGYKNLKRAVEQALARCDRSWGLRIIIRRACFGDGGIGRKKKKCFSGDNALKFIPGGRKGLRDVELSHGQVAMLGIKAAVCDDLAVGVELRKGGGVSVPCPRPWPRPLWVRPEGDWLELLGVIVA